MGIPWWIYLAVVIGIIGVVVIDILPPNVIAGVELLGKPFYEAGGGGPIFAIPGLMNVTMYDTDTRQKELPAEPELVQKDHQDAVDPNKKATIRIVQPGADTSKWFDMDAFEKDHRPFEKFMSYFVSWNVYLATRRGNVNDDTAKAIFESAFNKPMTTEVSAILEWKHRRSQGFLNTSGGVFDFIRNVHDDRLADQRLEDELVRAIQSVLVLITLTHTLELIDIISEYLRFRLEILIGEVPPKGLGDPNLPCWGIDLLKSALKLVDPGQHVNDAVARSAAEAAERQRKIQDGEAEKTVSMAATVAEAFKETEMGKARAANITAVGKALEDEGARFAALLETTEKVASHSPMIIASDFGGMVGSVTKMVQGAVEMNKKK